MKSVQHITVRLPYCAVILLSLAGYCGCATIPEPPLPEAPEWAMASAIHAPPRRLPPVIQLTSAVSEMISPEDVLATPSQVLDPAQPLQQPAAPTQSVVQNTAEPSGQVVEMESIPMPIMAEGGPYPAAAYCPPPVPHELQKTILPEYVIEPPDVLQIDAIHIAPKMPYFLRTFDVIQLELQRDDHDRLQPGDELQVYVPSAFPHAPINGPFSILSSGNIDLGPLYGSVRVAGMSLDEAKTAIENHLGPDQPPPILKDPTTNLLLSASAQPIQGSYVVQLGGMINLGMPYGMVNVSGMTIEQAQGEIERHLTDFFTNPKLTATVVQSGAQQEVAGPHLVGPDGMVTLGAYGNVPVVGLTVTQAKYAIEAHLSRFLEAPEIAVSMYSYNSKVYYLVTQGAGLGDGVYRFFVTGNETVLDAVSQINGLQAFSSKKIWIARPNPMAGGCKILEVDWYGITAGANAVTNYQILPGDRVFVAEDKLVAFDSALGKLIAPFERLMGFTILGASTATRLSGQVLRGGGNPRGLGGF